MRVHRHVIYRWKAQEMCEPVNLLGNSLEKLAYYKKMRSKVKGQVRRSPRSGYYQKRRSEIKVAKVKGQGYQIGQMSRSPRSSLRIRVIGKGRQELYIL